MPNEWKVNSKVEKINTEVRLNKCDHRRLFLNSDVDLSESLFFINL